jgi:hypothetical protein
MDSNKPDYIEASGQQGLRDVLDALQHLVTNDAEYRSKQHLIKYRFGDRTSILKVDMSEKPYQFWYFNLDMRRALEGADKNVIADFLKANGQQETIEVYFHDLYENTKKNKVDASQGLTNFIQPSEMLALTELSHCQRSLNPLVLPHAASPSLRGVGTLFSQPAKAGDQPKPAPEDNTPKP